MRWLVLPDSDDERTASTAALRSYRTSSAEASRFSVHLSQTPRCTPALHLPERRTLRLVPSV